MRAGYVGGRWARNLGWTVVRLGAVLAERVGIAVSVGNESDLGAVAEHLRGAAREVDVVSPGGTQRVEWRADGVYLTGWAEILFDANWKA